MNHTVCFLELTKSGALHRSEDEKKKYLEFCEKKNVKVFDDELRFACQKAVMGEENFKCYSCKETKDYFYKYWIDKGISGKNWENLGGYEYKAWNDAYKQSKRELIDWMSN